MSVLTEPFAYGYMVNAIWVSALVGALCGFLSTFLMLKGWSLIGDALSHAIVPGVAGAYMLGLPFAAGAFLSGGLAAAATLLLVSAVSSFLALNFTGSTPYTSRSGVKREMRLSMPVMAGSVVVPTGMSAQSTAAASTPTVVKPRQSSIIRWASRTASERCLATSLFMRSVACSPTTATAPMAITAIDTRASSSETPRWGKACCMCRSPATFRERRRTIR